MTTDEVKRRNERLHRALMQASRERGFDELLKKSRVEKIKNASKTATKYDESKINSQKIAQQIMKERVIENKILKYLENTYNNVFNTENTPVSVRIISQDLEIDVAEVRRICHQLAEIKKIQEISIGTYYKYYRVYGK
jgi:hypothetical protein